MSVAAIHRMFESSRRATRSDCAIFLLHQSKR